MSARWAGPPAACRASTWNKATRVVALAVVVPDATLLVAGENGIGKRTAFDEYRVQIAAAARASSP